MDPSRESGNHHGQPSIDGAINRFPVMQGIDALLDEKPDAIESGRLEYVVICGIVADLIYLGRGKIEIDPLAYHRPVLCRLNFCHKEYRDYCD